jgi:hypothetical protein
MHPRAARPAITRLSSGLAAGPPLLQVRSHVLT